MTSALKCRCPSCGRKLRVSERKQGRKVRCPSCRADFTANEGDATSSVSLEAAQSVALVDTVSNSDSRAGSVLSGPANLSRQEPTLRKLGRFELKTVLGQGAFGRVYRAFDPQLERFVALKVPTFGPNQKTRVKRFLAEAKAAARLKHPNIVTTFESGKADKKYYIASEFIDGELLSKRIRSEPLTTRGSVECVKKLAEALACAHQHGVIHRDVKPQNVMMDSSGEPRLMDFGLARRMDDESNLTTDGALLGTPAYMSPEQARGEVAGIGPASDQYSLGVVLFHLLTGSPPCEGSPHVVIGEVGKGKTYSARERSPLVDTDLDAICRRAMAPDPEDRYESCTDFAADLTAWLAGNDVIAAPPSVLQNAVRLITMNPTDSIVATSVAALALVLTVIGVNSGSDNPESHETPSITEAKAASVDVASEQEIAADSIAGPAAAVDAADISPPSRPDIVFQDFEDGSYGDWTASGESFGNRPYAPRNNPDIANSVLVDLNGEYVADSYFAHNMQHDHAFTGKLISPEFVIRRNYIAFLISTGSADRAGAFLRVNGRIRKSSDGSGQPMVMTPVSWDVQDFIGQKATIEIVDRDRGPAGRTCVDNFVFSDVDQASQWMQAIRQSVLSSCKEWQGRKYYFGSQKVRSEEAQAFARMVGGYLSCPGSQAERDFISQTMHGPSWLGIRNEDGLWRGENGEIFTHGPWRTGRPSSSHRTVAFITPDGELDTGGQYRPFVVAFDAPIAPQPYGIRNPAANRKLAARLQEDGVAASLTLVTSEKFHYLYNAATDPLPNDAFEIRQVSFADGAKLSTEVLDLFNGVKGIAWLQFRNNDDSVLDVLRYCPEIRYLEVNGGSYQWSALQSLESNNELRRVAFSAVKLTSDQLAPIATARALETIGFRGMRAEPGFMDTLVTQTHSLRRISFNAAGGLDREAFAKFARFKLVENLNLWASGVSDEDVDAIGGMESLKSAQLGYNRGITGRTLNELANLKALKSLSLWSTSVTDEGLVNLPPLPSLRKLALAGGGLTPQGIRHLEKYQTLRSVELSKSEALDDEVFTTLRKLPLLNHVETVDTNITKEGMAEFARDRPGFTSNILTRKDE